MATSQFQRRTEHLLEALTTLRIWEKRLQQGKSVILKADSASGAQLDSVIEIVQEMLDLQVEHSHRARKQKQKGLGENPMTRDSVWSMRARQNKRRPFEEALARYYKLYRPAMVEKIGGKDYYEYEVESHRNKAASDG